MKRTILALLATATLAHAQEGRWQINDGGSMRTMTVQEALAVDAIFAAQAQLETQQQQLDELRAIRALQQQQARESQQCQPRPMYQWLNR